ncbi:MAG: hypothetical protein ABSA62_04385 [Methyloceanibacter sp.]
MMRVGWIQWSAAAAIAALPLLTGGPLRAADQTGVRTVAEELGKRTKTPDAPADAPKDKLSDSAVRVMSTFALSILPDQIPDSSGAMIKLDKSDPNKYLIPIEDARSVIRVATRSAYAEACNLPELEKANYETLIRGERARKVWNTDQMMFIKALHTFATSYFAGNVKITEQAADDQGKAQPPGTSGEAAAKATEGPATTITGKKLSCSPEQKEKVTQAIGAYVQSAPPAAPQAATPAPAASQAAPPAPVAGGAN